MISWWPVENNANDIWGPNNGTLQGSPAFVAGEVGQAMSVDGTNGISVPDNASLNFGPGADFSIDAWIRTSDTTRTILTIVDKRLVSPPDGSGVVYGYAVFLFNGALAFQLADGTYQNDFTLSGDLRDGQWHHIAITVVRNSTTGGKAYVDGAVTGTFDPTAHQGDLSNSEPFLIGEHATDPTQRLHR